MFIFMEGAPVGEAGVDGEPSRNVNLLDSVGDISSTSFYVMF